MDTFTYNFPRCNKVESVFGQLKHAAGEIVEASAEVTNSDTDCAVEILDAIECLEGALRHLDGMYGGTLLPRAMRQHERKNMERGYYD